MKHLLTFLVLSSYFLPLWAQPKPVKVAKNANHFVYEVYEYGEKIDTQYTQIEIYGGYDYLIADGKHLPGEYRPASQAKGDVIKGYSVEDIFVNELTDSVTYLTTIFDGSKKEQYRTRAPYSRTDIHFDTTQVGDLTRYTCSINSNTLEFYVLPFKTIWHAARDTKGVQSRDLTPLPQYGHFPGLVVSYWRNGQCRMQLVKTERMHSSKFHCPQDVPVVTPRELARIKRERMVVTTRIFDSVQLCWAGKNDHIEGDYRENTPYDSVLHFAGGTLALKRVRLPQLPKHYQTFVELHQRSNGDAYDRTGSLFVIPTSYFGITFLEGIFGHPDSLPLFIGRDGQRYQGIVSTRFDHPTHEWVIRYHPPVELMRFFTPFGVGKFNDRVQIDGLEWQEEAFFRQEVTDLKGYLQGDDIWIGVWIGNYDKGGHIVTVDIKSYPNDTWQDNTSSEGDDEMCLSLFNTCNVLEMAGQNYGKLFATDSLTTEFSLWGDTNRHVKLRYIATGHGGWDGGDEFNPKTHTILIDGQEAFTYTPWRSDCGRYREWNPVSGNFWNGLSSSDYSRSGWCPGTATQPVYFDLTEYFRKHHLPIAGRHTITVTIPQGEPQAGSFSHWCVSGVLVTE